MGMHDGRGGKHIKKENRGVVFIIVVFVLVMLAITCGVVTGR